MRFALVFAILLSVGCAAGSIVQSVAGVCGSYSHVLVALAPYKGDMSESQVASVDLAVGVLAPVCEGEIPTGDASSLMASSLSSLEAILTELAKED